MQLFADFSGYLNKNKKPLWTIYLKKLNTEFFFNFFIFLFLFIYLFIFFLSEEEVVLSSQGFFS